MSGWELTRFWLSSISVASVVKSIRPPKYRKEKRFYKYTRGDNISTGPFQTGSVQRWVMGWSLKKWPQSVFLTLMSINSNESLDLDPCSVFSHGSVGLPLKSSAALSSLGHEKTFQHRLPIVSRG